MINNIYFDLDQTLAHTEFYEPEQKHISFSLEDYGKHYSIIHPRAKDVIDYARNLVGQDRVFILTAAVKEYACEIDRLAGWGFGRSRIFSREDLHAYSYPVAYGGSATVGYANAHKDNVIIDNLQPVLNYSKLRFLGITDFDNYLKVRDYFGVDFPDDSFYNDVVKFLNDKNKNNSPDPIPTAVAV